jgi:hypothetical protein
LPHRKKGELITKLCGEDLQGIRYSQHLPVFLGLLCHDEAILNSVYDSKNSTPQIEIRGEKRGMNDPLKGGLR